MNKHNNQDKPVLIIAQNARFLVQSATKAGFITWVADCFGDTDTRNASHKWQQLPALSTLTQHDFISLLTTLSQGRDCYLVYGSGIELFSSFLAILPKNITLLGNDTETITQIKTPLLFFNLLNRLSIRHPTVIFSLPERNQQHWLLKSAKGFGGIHIKHVSQSTISLKPDQYLQKKINGISISALFLVCKNNIVVLSINKQYTETNNFKFKGIETPFPLSIVIHDEITNIIKKLAHEINLVGLNSIDFILSTNQQLFVLEINPRPSASIELIEQSQSVFKLHYLACLGYLKCSDIRLSIKPRSLRYLYTDHDIIIPKEIIWPASCRDLPAEHTVIKTSAPICTSIVNKIGNEADKLHKKNYQIILKQIHSILETK